MQTDTMIGFLLVSVMIILQAVCKFAGVDGEVTTAINVIIATGLLLITGKRAITKA